MPSLRITPTKAKLNPAPEPTNIPASTLQIRKKSFMVLNENNFLLKSIIHEKVQNRISEPKNINPLFAMFCASMKYLRHLSLSKITQKLNLGRPVLRKKCHRIQKVLWNVVLVLKFIHMLKWRTKLRKLSLITDREIAFIDDASHFTQDDLMRRNYECSSCLKIHSFQTILSIFN